MRVFITGGSGLTGPAVVAELIGAGHRVTGLARSASAAARLRELGADAVIGSLDDLVVLRDSARDSDGVIHMAFDRSATDPQELVDRDRTAIETLGEALIDSGRPLVGTSGAFVMAPGRVSHERDRPDPASVGALRVPGELACLSFADHGVRASVVRLAPTVHGRGDTALIAVYIAIARRTGVAGYVDDGSNRWPAIHRADAATLFRLALERAEVGSAAHGAGESAIPFRTIADLVAQRLQIRARSLSIDQAAEHFGSVQLARSFGADVPMSSEETRVRLGWTPTHPTLSEDLSDGDYFG